MKIIKHKSIDMTAEEIVQAVETQKIPSGIAINLSGDDLVVEPLDCVNLLGIIDENYETIFYKE